MRCALVAARWGYRSYAEPAALTRAERDRPTCTTIGAPGDCAKKGGVRTGPAASPMEDQSVFVIDDDPDMRGA
jgi:hypothetical protein